jgi:hypothetical protein
MKRTVGQRVSLDGYAKILAVIAAGDARSDAVSAAILMQYDRCERVLQWMEYFGAIHVCDWHITKETRVRRAVPVYRMGDGESVPKPFGRRRLQRPGRSVPVELMAFCDAVKELQAECHHGRSLAEATGLNQQTCRRLMRNLKLHGLAFIEQYEARNVGGFGYPMYRFGLNRQDARKPKPKSEAQQARERRGRKAQRELSMRLLGIAANDDMRAAA